MSLSFEPKPFEQALKYWDSKVQLSPGQYAKLTDAAKVRAFAVGGMAKGDQLDSIFQAMRKQMESGVSFADFKKDIASVIEARGWTGPRARRIETIFRTNLQTAYQVGRYEQMTANAANRPWWMYDAVMDGSTRPTHAAMHGKVFRYDHQFWDTWWPLNGYLCRCSVRALSDRQLQARGLTPETDDPTNKLIEPINPESGVKMPARRMIPDRGFAVNPGRSAWGGVVDGRIVEGGLPEAMGNLKGPADYRRRTLENIAAKQIADLDESMLLKSGLTDEQYKQAFIDLYGEETVLTDVMGEPVILSLRAFEDRAKGGWKFHKDGHGQIIPLIQSMIESPYEVWLTPQVDKAGKVRLGRRYITLWKTQDKKRVAGMAVFEVIDGVAQGVTAFVPHKKGEPNLPYTERQRKGLLLYGKGR
ncbi:phage minor head protein [uncultured Desulfuromonas sp.]|uniref:phage minor head protein n=1 Tax=uncultured Desulfuromonas sp. TaxID=181013 RepID=UPI002AABC018|nr:phage minor head protein [uncultured Desulfuromonas sp.]